MAKDTFSIDSQGFATLYEKGTNKPTKCWPVDAREILQSSDDYLPQPAKTIVDKVSSPSSTVVEVEVPTVTRESLEKMIKKDLVNLAHTHGIEIPEVITASQIKDILIEKLEL